MSTPRLLRGSGIFARWPANGDGRAGPAATTATDRHFEMWARATGPMARECEVERGAQLLVRRTVTAPLRRYRPAPAQAGPAGAGQVVT